MHTVSVLTSSVAKQWQQVKGQRYHHFREKQQGSCIFKLTFPAQTLLKGPALGVLLSPGSEPSPHTLAVGWIQGHYKTL